MELRQQVRTHVYITLKQSKGKPNNESRPTYFNLENKCDQHVGDNKGLHLDKSPRPNHTGNEQLYRHIILE